MTRRENNEWKTNEELPQKNSPTEKKFSGHLHMYCVDKNREGEATYRPPGLKIVIG